MSERARAGELLCTALDTPDARFRDGQLAAIEAITRDKRRALVVQRTGWGKSLVYFIATKLLRERGAGPTLIVSPLLSLMRNQIEAATRIGLTAQSIDSTNTDIWSEIEEAVAADAVDLLLISPERLANERFHDKVLSVVGQNVGLLVIDEAHLISDWGHDFRPDYRRLVNVLGNVPRNLPILGTTATANDRVIDDIQRQLGDVSIQRGPLQRGNIALQTLNLPNQASRLAWLASNLPKLPGSGIVYTLTRRDADTVADWLADRGLAARAYHAGVQHHEVVDEQGRPDTTKYRQALEDMLARNEIKVLVATTALAMGYDKPDLGFVVHYQAPGSIIAYYQQVGRAGRAIPWAYGVLMTGEEDAEINEYFRRTAFPAENDVAAVLDALAESEDGLSPGGIQDRVNLRQGQITHILKYLSVEDSSPIVKEGKKWRRTASPYTMDRDRIQRVTQQREWEWQQIQDYIATGQCLMAYLADALNDPDVAPCGVCANCTAREVVPVTGDREHERDAARFLRRAEMPLTLRSRSPKDAFAAYGWAKADVLKPADVGEGRILSRWNDAGWGARVAEDKHQNRFQNDLVEAVVEMVQERWKPDPAPAWVTCVPSRKHPTLVPDFARAVADRLGLPFTPVVAKVADNQPQKLQENRYHQCRNLDGVFRIEGSVPAEPVLLLDDVVGSGWTLTVIAALLRQAGSGRVFPAVLSTSGVSA